MSNVMKTATSCYTQYNYVHNT